MSFCAMAWSRTADLQQAILEHPFNVALAAGTLDQDRFAFYLVQDSRYLVGFAKALAAAAARLPNPVDAAFFAGSAQTALAVERSLHGEYLAGFGVSAAETAGIETSPACEAYTSYLHSVALTEPHQVLVAALLPCFWVYEHVGRTIRDKAGDLSGHPYARWIATYAHEDFAESVRRAREVADRLAAGADRELERRMGAAFTRGCEYEWLFWDSAWRLETWPTRRWRTPEDARNGMSGDDPVT
jgi:thiaminase/transcriptional activator TenA